MNIDAMDMYRDNWYAIIIAALKDKSVSESLNCIGIIAHTSGKVDKKAT